MGRCRRPSSRATTRWRGEHVDRFQSIFGRDSFFVELQDHGLPEQLQVNPQLIKLARDMRAPLLATNDSHYTHRDDAEAHDALLCVQTGAMRDDPKRFKFDADEFYLKTAQEMRDLFSDYEEACDNTLLIAERADVEIEFGNSVLPTFPTPPGHDEDSYLRELCIEGAKERYGISPGPEVLDRRHSDRELPGIRRCDREGGGVMPKPEPFHPDVRAARWFPRAGVSRRTLRLFRKPPRPRASTADVDVSTLAIRTTGGELPYRVYRPLAAGGTGPALFWIHGWLARDGFPAAGRPLPHRTRTASRHRRVRRLLPARPRAPRPGSP